MKARRVVERDDVDVVKEFHVALVECALQRMLCSRVLTMNTNKFNKRHEISIKIV